MADDWGFFERQSEDKELMRILVNCAWKQDAHPPGLNQLLSITINLYSIRSRHKNKESMISELERMEHELEEAVQAGGNSVYIGRINTPRRLEYYYYMESGASLEPLQKILSSRSGSRLMHYVKPDSDWEFYRYLLPDTLEELFIHNAQMVYALLNRGMISGGRAMCIIGCSSAIMTDAS